MIPPEHESLWSRVSQFEIDDPNASVKFSDKLAFHNNWSPEYTRRVIEEYKRFIFLCTISPTGASPSEAVDEAWHLHLTYTQNYWKVFCKDVIQKEIHHHPSTGGPQEKQRHVDWYVKTLRYYETIFDKSAPTDIWPSMAAPVKTSASSTTITEDEPRPDYLKKWWVLVLPFLTPFVYGKLSPFSLTGSQFLVFYALLIVGAFGFLYIVNAYQRSKVEALLHDQFDFRANAFQITQYLFGRERSLQAAVVDLIERKILSAERKKMFTFLPGKYAYSKEENNPLLPNLLRNYSEWEKISYDSIRQSYNMDMTAHDKFEIVFRELNRKDPWKYIAIILPAGIGVARIIQGFIHDKPAGYLLLMMICSFIAMYIYLRSGNKTNIAQRLIQSRYQDLQLGNDFPRTVFHDFAFLGIGALAYSAAYYNLESTFQNRRLFADSSGDASASYSSGCGSSCGSSCGGGCGGGCGGCGGD